MARERLGTIEPHGAWPDGTPRFRYRLRLADGSKTKRYDVPRGRATNEAEAKAYVAKMQALEDASGTLIAAKRARAAEKKVARPTLAIDAAEMDRWFDAWEASRVAKGLASTRDNRGHYQEHIRPALDGKHVRDWTAADVRSLVRALDDKVRAAEIEWKTALHIWTTARKMSADAVRSKLDTLRVRTDNPTANVEGPDRGEDKSKPFLYPSEFLKFVTCEGVPLEWRRAVTLAVLLYPRDGELRVLKWEDGDVDLDHGTIHIHRAWDRRANKVTSTKTGCTRRFNIEPALLPLLRQMHDEAGGRGPVVALPSMRDMARGLRGWLSNAGVTRPELHVSTRTTKKLAWHDLRATGITWMAVRGDDPLKIMQRAGHSNFQTTQIYIRTAEAIREGFGEPFPTLPSTLFGSASLPPETGSGGGLAQRLDQAPNSSMMLAGRTGLERVHSAFTDVNTQTSERQAPTTAYESPRYPVDAASDWPNLVQSEEAFGPTDPIEAALARALEAASAAGRFDVVAQIAKELEALLASVTNVVPMRSRSRRT